MRSALAVIAVVGCGGTSKPPVPVVPPLVVPVAIAPAVGEATLGAAGTILMTERIEEPCHAAVRVLLHVEGMLRPSEWDPEDDELGGFRWLDARTPRAGVEGCPATQAYVGDPMTLRPGMRIAAFARGAPDAQGYTLDVRSARLVLLYAAPFSELPRIAEVVGATRPLPAPLPSSTPRLTARGDVLVDVTTSLRWQRDGAPAPLYEGAAHAYCEALVLDGRDDWRVPEADEARTVGAALPSEAEAYYWTATDDDGAIVAEFSTGELTSTHYDDPGPLGPYRVRCVSGYHPAAWQFLRGITTRTPAPAGPPSRRYPTGDVAAIGERTYWELGALASDGPRGYYADGRLATERRGDTLHLFAPAGDAIGTIALTDGPIAITAAAMTVTATIRGGALAGPALVDGAAGAYADGAMTGRWERRSEGRVVASTTYRAGMRHGPATGSHHGTWTGGYANGYRDGVWRHTSGETRSEATFVGGTGVQRFWYRAQRTREEPYVRDLRHGTMSVWSTTGTLVLRIRYVTGSELESLSVSDSGARVEKTVQYGETHYFASGAKESESTSGYAGTTYTAWDEAGQVVETGLYAGLGRTTRIGTWRTRRPDGTYVVTEWIAGRLAAAPRIEAAP